MSNQLRTAGIFASLTLVVISAASAQRVDGLELVGHYENSNTYTNTYVAKYSDIYPEDAQRVRRQIAEFKQAKNREIQAALQAGNRDSVRRIQQDARQRLERLVQQINAEHPPTQIKTWGTATKSDILAALLLLKNSPNLLGQTMHVYVFEGKVSVSPRPPKDYEKPASIVSSLPGTTFQQSEADKQRIARQNPFDAMMMGRDPVTGKKL